MHVQTIHNTKSMLEIHDHSTITVFHWNICARKYRNQEYKSVVYVKQKEIWNRECKIISEKKGKLTFSIISPLSRFINLHFIVLSDTVNILSTHCPQQSVKKQKHKHQEDVVQQTMDLHSFPFTFPCLAALPKIWIWWLLWDIYI